MPCVGAAQLEMINVVSAAYAVTEVDAAMAAPSASLLIVSRIMNSSLSEIVRRISGGVGFLVPAARTGVVMSVL